jgi:hypothetical protein
MSIFPRSLQRSTSTASDLSKATQWEEYCDSELIPTEQSDRSVSKSQSILALIKNRWQNAIAALTKEPELKIWQKQDRYGHVHWHVYNPCTDESFSFVSELEMLSWIDHLNCRNRW